MKSFFRMRSLPIFLLFLGLNFTLTFPAIAAPRLVNLKTALKLASEKNLELASKYMLVEQAQGKLGLVNAAQYPKLMGTAILSPIFSSTGNAISSTNDMHKWGGWLQGNITVLQPIYTWGKISNYKDAAQHGIEVAQAQHKKSIQELHYSVKEIYYGALLAEQLFELLSDGKKDIDEVLKKAQADQQKKKPNIPKRDFFRLQIFAAEAGYRYEEAKKLRELSHHALSLLLGFDPEEETLPEESALEPIIKTPPNELDLINLMAQERPEFQQLTNGIQAKRALLNAEESNKYPTVFVGGMLTFAYSNVRDRQQSSYAFDPYNRQSGGVGIGIQWNWDFATTLANEAVLKSEIDELEKKELYARAGLRMELKKTLADLSEAKTKVDNSAQALNVGKRWLVSETMGYSLGVNEIKNLIDAYLARAKTAKDHWEAIYNLNLTWAALSKTVGSDLDL